MYSSLGLDVSISMFFYIMVSIGFVIGIILMVAPEAYELLSKALNREYGLKHRFFRKIENDKFENLDRFATRHSVVIGMILSITTFILLIIYK